MPQYLCEVAYSPQGWAAVVEKQQNRMEAIRPAVEKLGGRIKDAWFAFGDYDVIAVFEMPDHINAAALSIAFPPVAPAVLSRQGHLSALRTESRPSSELASPAIDHPLHRNFRSRASDLWQGRSTPCPRSQEASQRTARESLPLTGC